MQDQEGSGAQGSKKYVIKVTSGNDSGKTVTIAEDTRITLGRKPENTVSVSDIKVSGVHAEIVFSNGKPLLRDLGSANGTFLGENEVNEIFLSSGTKFSLGETGFTFLMTGGAAVKKAPAQKIESARSQPKPQAKPQPKPRPTPAGNNKNGAMTDEVHVIRDVRPVRRGVGGIILLIILIIALGGAGYYYFIYMSPKVSVSLVEAEKDNILANGWSFEEAGGAGNISDFWNLDSENGASFTISKKSAKSGLYSVEAGLGQGALATAVYDKTFKVNTRRQYRATAWIKISGNAMAGLKAMFYAKGENGEKGEILYTDDFAAGREEGVVFTKIEGAVVPPPEAGFVEFMICAAGEGRVNFDDLGLFEESTSDLKQLGSAGGMDFYSCGGGFVIRRIGRTLFKGGRVLATIKPEQDGENSTINSDLHGFLIGNDRYLYCGEGAGMVRSTSSMKVNAQKTEGDVAIPDLGSVPKLNDLRYCFDIFKEYAMRGVGVISNGEFNLYNGPFAAMEAETLHFGGLNDKVKLTFDNPVNVACTETKQGGLSFQCVFSKGPARRFVFDIQSDFNEEIKAAQKLTQQATRAEQEERYGEALGLIDQIMKRYPYNESVMDKCGKLRRSISTVKKEWLASIKTALRSAEFLNTPELFIALEADCKKYLTFFPEDTDFTAALDDVKQKSSVIMNSIRDEKAEKFYYIAKNLFQAGRRQSTFSEVLGYMQDKFAGSEWTEKAMLLGKEEGSESEEIIEDANDSVSENDDASTGSGEN